MSIPQAIGHETRICMLCFFVYIQPQLEICKRDTHNVDENCPSGDVGTFLITLGAFYQPLATSTRPIERHLDFGHPNNLHFPHAHGGFLLVLSIIC